MKKAVNIVRFHGMTVISDNDCISVRDNNVIEVSSAGNLVCRYYNKDGLEEDDSFQINIFDSCMKSSYTEANITGSIKRQIGSNKLLISESAVNYIKQFVS